MRLLILALSALILVEQMDLTKNQSVLSSYEDIINMENKKDSTPYYYNDLPIPSEEITIQSLLRGIYRRDSTSLNVDFDVLLQPALYYYTPLDSIPINTESDTVYIQLRTSYPGRFVTNGIIAWNKKMAIHAGTSGYGYERKTGLRDWEQRLIESWDLDSIKTLTEPTFYTHYNPDFPEYIVYQIIISNGKAKSRFMKYEYLYIPNEYKDDPTRNKIIRP